MPLLCKIMVLPIGLVILRFEYHDILFTMLYCLHLLFVILLIPRDGVSMESLECRQSGNLARCCGRVGSDGNQSLARCSVMI